MYIDLDMVRLAHDEADTYSYKTTLYRGAKAAVVKFSRLVQHRMRQYSCLWITFEAAATIHEMAGAEGDRMRRCAHAAYERVVLDMQTDAQINLLFPGSIDAAFAIIYSVDAEDRRAVFRAIETRMMFQLSGIDVHGSAYPLPFAEQTRDLMSDPTITNARGEITQNTERLLVRKSAHGVDIRWLRAGPLISPDGTQDMTRLGFDALHLQSMMSNGQELTIEHIATEVFGTLQPDGSRTKTKVSLQRAKQAAINMVTLKRAVALPDRATLTSIRAKYSTEGTQLEALMNMAVRDGVSSRKAE